MNIKEWKAGDKIRQEVEFELVKPLDYHEVLKKLDGSDMELFNPRLNKWWAKINGDLGPLVVVCVDV